MKLLDLLPERPEMDDGELNEWLLEHGGRGREVLTYRKIWRRDPLTNLRYEKAECSCSVCGSTWETESFASGEIYSYFETAEGLKKNGDRVSCPGCGSNLTAACYTRLKRHPIKSTNYLWEILSRKGNLLFLCWAVEFEVDEYGPGICSHKRNAYVLDIKGKWHRFTAMERSGWSSMCRMDYTGKWYAMDRFTVVDGNWGNLLPMEPDVYRGTALENAKMEELEQWDQNFDRIRYAKLYLRHPTIENIARNSPRLMLSLLYQSWGYTGLDWLNYASAKPHEMLYMEKPDYRMVERLSKEEQRRILWQQKAVAACVKWGAPKAYASQLGKWGVDFALRRKKNPILQKWGLMQTWNCICKVRDEDENRMRASADALTLSAMDLCEDYWKDMSKAGLDENSRVVVFPKNLKEAHARAVAAIKYQESEKLRAKFEETEQKLLPLCWGQGGILIRPAKSESELIGEGKALGHCVGGYGESHCKGNSIFFIRRSDDPDLPWYTLQLNTENGAVIQNRGKKNCERTEEVRAFEKEWLRQVVMPWILEKQRKKAGGEAAA